MIALGHRTTTKNLLQRYFIAILPPPDIAARARALQQQLTDKYNTRAALRSPPHITLHMPFGWKENKEQELIRLLGGFFTEVKSFRVSINDLGAFPPRVIYMNVEKTGELVDCQRKLSKFCRVKLGLFNDSFRDEPYHPHLTLAFRDLRKPAFLAAWETYERTSFLADFAVEAVHLLKHNGMEWSSHHSFRVGMSQ